MFKSNKWLYFLLSIPFLLLFLTFLSYGNFLLNNNGKFVHENEKIIKSAIITYLENEEKQSINSIKLLPNTARGGMIMVVMWVEAIIFIFQPMSMIILSSL